MRVGILGAGGYLAQNLAYYLKQQGIVPLLYARNPASLSEAASVAPLDFCSDANLETIDFSVDVMYFMVGKGGTGASFTNAASFIEANVQTLAAYLSAHVRNNSRAVIVLPSTRLVYQGSAEKLGEDAAKEVRTVYALAKTACEQLLDLYGRIYGISYKVFRISVPYGNLVDTTQSYGTVELFAARARAGEPVLVFGTGEDRRTFTYIEDVCTALVEGAKQLVPCNTIYNIGGENLSLNDAAELIAAHYRVTVSHVEPDNLQQKIESGSTVFDSSKLDALLGLRYDMRLETWLNQTDLPVLLSHHCA